MSRSAAQRAAARKRRPPAPPRCRLCGARLPHGADACRHGCPPVVDGIDDDLAPRPGLEPVGRILLRVLPPLLRSAAASLRSRR